MSWMDALAKLGEIAKNVTLIQKRVEDAEKLALAQDKEIAELRKEIAALTTRVAVLEEGRKTVGAEVKLALTEAIRGWENDQLRKALERLNSRSPLPPPE
jgi:hypothetical protein